ncbi:MAG: hypothetical protein JW727_05730 [Candidatus Aenigmarchaeota archaeon]|nr:hypothetical protein [Candidatus Aenigmarchaeota archaeon]
MNGAGPDISVRAIGSFRTNPAYPLVMPSLDGIAGGKHVRVLGKLEVNPTIDGEIRNTLQALMLSKDDLYAPLNNLRSTIGAAKSFNL